MIGISNIQESHFLKNLYPQGLDLDEIILDSVHLSYDGPTLKLYIQSKKLPESPPKKWTSQYDTVRIELELFETSAIDMRRWGRQNLCDVKISKSDETLRVHVKGEDCSIEVQTKWIYFRSISPFLTD